jgi:hypothetical protein
MKFIKLTFIDNRTTFVNTETISRMTRSVSNDSKRPVDTGFDLPLLKEDRDFTHISAGGDWFKVKETPEEIMALINDDTQHQPQTFEFGELTIDEDGFPALNISYVDENGNTQHEGLILYKRQAFAIGPEESRSECLSEYVDLTHIGNDLSDINREHLLSAFASSAIAKWCAEKKLVPREEIDLFCRSKQWIAFINACIEWMWPQNKE